MEGRSQMQGGQNMPPGFDDPRRRRALTPNEMTEDELRVLKECERDSFYLRALPLSAGCILGAQYMVRTGRWNPHPKFGAIPKTIIFGFLGYMAGKISYVPVCRQKILEQIPNSNLARQIKGNAGQTHPGNENTMQEWENQPLPKSKDDYSSFSQAPSGILETTPPAGIDDRFRPSVDSDSKNENIPNEEEKKMTYEEMRRRNRQQYEESKAKQPPKSPSAPSYKESPMMPQKPWLDQKDRFDKSDSGSGDPLDQPPSPPSQGQSKKKRTNIWGDVIED